MKSVGFTYNIPYEGMLVPVCQRLSAALRALPEFRGYDQDECPVWFGFEKDGGAYLWASVEPSGLRVEGRLDEDDWEKWEEAFLASTSLVLGFQVKDADE